MTQAFNLSQLANKVNTSGQLDIATGVTGTMPVANGGTGQSNLANGNVILGNGTSAVTTVAPSTSGNVLTSNGTSWVSQAGAVSGVGIKVFTTSGTWTLPAGVTKCIVEVYGAGGGGNKSPGLSSTSRFGGLGGYAKAYVTGLTSNVAVTVGLGSTFSVPGGSSSFGSFATATGGAGASTGGNGGNGSGSVSGATLLKTCFATQAVGSYSSSGGGIEDLRTYVLTVNNPPASGGSWNTGAESFGVGGLVQIEW